MLPYHDFSRSLIFITLNFQPKWHLYIKPLKKKTCQCPGGPVVRTLALPRAWIQSLVGELSSPQAVSYGQKEIFFFFFQKGIFIPVRSNDLQAQWRSRGTEKVRHSQVWDLGQYVCVYTCVCICTCAYTRSVTAHQAPQSMGFFRQEYWSRMTFCPSSFPPGQIVSPALAVRFFTIELPGMPQYLGQVTAFSKRFHMCEMKVKSKY